MRLSEWRQRAPFKDSASAKVMAVVEQAVVVLGADRDPACWVAWGDDPNVRYLVLVPTPPGLLQINVRVNVPGEGPRAGGKLVRWSRVQLGELAVEIQGGHRLVTFQVETQVLNGVDGDADRISAFAQSLFAAADGRPGAYASPTPKRRTTAGSTAKPGGRQIAKPGGRQVAKPVAKSAAKSVPRLAAVKGSAP